ncbi:MAG TPA: hypothetical protein VJ715_04960, partial [Pyrinomonadaceae bacterium]|nr:hypothetical protein [Pyrinomonadaceae bacterium]
VRAINFRGLTPSRKLSFPLTVARGASLTVELLNLTPPTAAISVPAAEHLYDGKLFGQELAVTASVELDGATFPVEAATRMDVAPAVEIAGVSPSPLVLTRAAHGFPSPGVLGLGIGPAPGIKFSLRLINHRGEPFKGRVVIGGDVSKATAAGGVPVTLAAKEERAVEVRREGDFTLIADSVRGGAHAIPNVVTFHVVEDDSSRAVVQSKVRVVWADASVAPNLRVGYVRSFDDTLRDSLSALGVEAKELKVEDVSAGDLSKYHAIIVDNRGYQAHPELVAANQRLLDYVREGGTLIVFYHRTNEWNPDAEKKRPQLAPYPLTLGNSRVTDETAPIQFTEPQHQLLNYPNKITPEDFSGWIQERGLYYPEKWDAHYSAPLAMSDRGEALLRGGLLAADYGRGRYVYTSMVWYRQLRAGVPGAYRVLANMISYGRRER